MNMLVIEDLHATVDGVAVLRGVNLVVPAGEIHAIMGPNGAGKSTLAKVLAGHPAYEVTQGAARLQGENLLELDPEERALKGLFMGFQYPVEVAGVTNRQFLEVALRARKLDDFEKRLQAAMELMEVRPELVERNLNEGFSGGEKKRNEMLQMALLEPLVAILDETDSGLDMGSSRVDLQACKLEYSIVSPK